MTPQRARPGAATTRSWAIVKKKLLCFTASIQKCYVTPLVEAGRSDFHDAELQNATEEINRILDRVERDNEDDSRHLCFIQHQNRFMLVWSEHDEVVSSEETNKMAKALKIRRGR